MLNQLSNLGVKDGAKGVGLSAGSIWLVPGFDVLKAAHSRHSFDQLKYFPTELIFAKSKQLPR